MDPAPARVDFRVCLAEFVVILAALSIVAILASIKYAIHLAVFLCIPKCALTVKLNWTHMSSQFLCFRAFARRYHMRPLTKTLAYHAGHAFSFHRQLSSLRMNAAATSEPVECGPRF